MPLEQGRKRSRGSRIRVGQGSDVGLARMGASLLAGALSSDDESIPLPVEPRWLGSSSHEEGYSDFEVDTISATYVQPHRMLQTASGDSAGLLQPTALNERLAVAAHFQSPHTNVAVTHPLLFCSSIAPHPQLVSPRYEHAVSTTPSQHSRGGMHIEGPQSSSLQQPLTMAPRPQPIIAPFHMNLGEHQQTVQNVNGQQPLAPLQNNLSGNLLSAAAAPLSSTCTTNTEQSLRFHQPVNPSGLRLSLAVQPVLSTHPQHLSQQNSTTSLMSRAARPAASPLPSTTTQAAVAAWPAILTQVVRDLLNGQARRNDIGTRSDVMVAMAAKNVRIPHVSEARSELQKQLEVIRPIVAAAKIAAARAAAALELGQAPDIQAGTAQPQPIHTESDARMALALQAADELGTQQRANTQRITQPAAVYSAAYIQSLRTEGDKAQKRFGVLKYRLIRAAKNLRTEFSLSNTMVSIGSPHGNRLAAWNFSFGPSFNYQGIQKELAHHTTAARLVGPRPGDVVQDPDEVFNGSKKGNYVAGAC